MQYVSIYTGDGRRETNPGETQRAGAINRRPAGQPVSGRRCPRAPPPRAAVRISACNPRNHARSFVSPSPSPAAATTSTDVGGAGLAATFALLPAGRLGGGRTSFLPSPPPPRGQAQILRFVFRRGAGGARAGIDTHDMYLHAVQIPSAVVTPQNTRRPPPPPPRPRGGRRRIDFSPCVGCAAPNTLGGQRDNPLFLAEKREKEKKDRTAVQAKRTI